MTPRIKPNKKTKTGLPRNFNGGSTKRQLLRDEIYYGFASFLSKITLAVVIWSGVLARGVRLTKGDNRLSNTPDSASGSGSGSEDDGFEDGLWAGLGSAIAVSFILAFIMFLDYRRSTFDDEDNNSDCDGEQQSLMSVAQAAATLRSASEGKPMSVKGMSTAEIAGMLESGTLLLTDLSAGSTTSAV